MSIIEQIKAEIKRLKEYTVKCGYPGQDEYADGNKEGRNFICDKLLSFLDTLEEPVCEELNEAAKNYENSLDYYHYTGDNPSIAFIAGANWQADHTPLPEDTVLFNKGVAEGKRLMMEEAVGGEVTQDNSGNNVVRSGVFNKDFEYGDKVRIIILPKED